MGVIEGNHNETIISFFDQKITWWTDVYREDLPRGFFSFEMRNRLKLVAEQLSAQIQQMDNPDVLECGCGPGDILEQLAPLHCKLTGLDLNRRYLDMSAQRVPGATMVDGDVEHLPFPDESFDIVYAVGVLLYVKNDHLAIKEIARVTKNGGYVVISVSNYMMLHLLLDPYYVYKYIKKMLCINRKITNTDFDESKIRRYTLRKLIRLCGNYNMNEIRTLSTSFGPIRFWCKKLFSLYTSIKISESIRNLSNIKIFSSLNHVGNHLVISLRKG